MKSVGNSRQLFWLVAPLVLGLVTVLVWWFPVEKPAAALGRFSYPEFLLAIGVTITFAAALALALTRPEARRRRVFQLIAVFMSGGCALAVAELVATILPPVNNPFSQLNLGDTVDDTGEKLRLPYVRPPHIHWEGLTFGNIGEWQPDELDRQVVTFKTDQHGFRNSEDLNQADLVFIGDSFTEAGNVSEEESFVRLAAGELNLTARNLGLSGIPPPAEAVILERFGLPCEPRVVVWQIYEGNDLPEAWRYDTWREAGYPPMTRQQGASRWEQWSLSYCLFRQFVPRERDWLAGQFRCSDGSQRTVRFGFAPSPDWIPLLPNGQGHSGWKPIVDALTQGSRQLNERKIRLIVLHIPAKMTVMGEHVEFDGWSKQQGVPQATRVPTPFAMATHLAVLCDRLGVSFIDSTESLTAHSKNGELVYFPSDTHLAPAGHSVISQLVVEAISAGSDSVEKE
jgi:hypothetical protein